MIAAEPSIEGKHHGTRDERTARSRVLIVEDNVADATLFASLLAEREAFEIVRAARLAEAEAMLRRGGIDAVLLDLVLPDAQGLPVVERVVRAAPGTAVVVASGMADEDLVLARAAVALGAQDWLPKSVIGTHGELLARTVATALERMRLRRALAERERRLEEAQRLGGFGYWRWHPGTPRVWLSRPLAELLGSAGTEEEVRARAVLRALLPADRRPLLAGIRRARCGAQPVRVTCRRHDRRRIFEVEIRARGGDLVGLCRDVTDLRAAERARELFFVSAGHELRTPATAVLTSLELLRILWASRLPAGARELVDRAARGTRRLVDLLEGLLALRGLEVDGAVHDLATWLRRTVDDLRTRNEPTDGLRLLCPRTPVPARFHPEALARALGELLVLVDEATPRCGPVSIVLRTDGDAALLILGRDGGVEGGACPSHPLEEIDLARAARAGHALGLAVARELITGMGGMLRIGPRQGDLPARMAITLPLADRSGPGEIA